MSQNFIQRGIVGIELKCYKVIYTSEGEPIKISHGVPVKTNPDSTTIMQVMRGRKYFLLENEVKTNPIAKSTSLLRGEIKSEKKVKANPIAKTSTEVMQDKTYFSLDDPKFEVEVERVEVLIKQLKADHAAAQANSDASMWTRPRILGLVVSVISCLTWIYFALFERRKEKHFGFFGWRKKNQDEWWKRNQDAPIGASLSAAFVIVGLIPWLRSIQRGGTGQGLTVVGLVVLPCIAASLDTEDASHAPWEQVALVAVTVVFLYHI